MPGQVVPPTDVSLGVFENRRPWDLWKNGEDEQDYPNANTVKVKFEWSVQ